MECTLVDINHRPGATLALAHPLVVAPLSGAIALLLKAIYDSGLCNPKAVAEKIKEWAVKLQGLLQTVIAKIDQKYPEPNAERAAFLQKLEDTDTLDELRKMDTQVYKMGVTLVKRAKGVIQISVCSWSRYTEAWNVQVAIKNAAVACDQYETRLLTFSERALDHLDDKEAMKKLRERWSEEDNSSDATASCPPPP